jgi:hypothetical protein
MTPKYLTEQQTGEALHPENLAQVKELQYMSYISKQTREDMLAITDILDQRIYEVSSNDQPHPNISRKQMCWTCLVLYLLRGAVGVVRAVT